MELYTAQMMRDFDKNAIENLKIPSTLLMENAAGALARSAADIARNKSVLVFCGSGNNGGDGLAAARFLLRSGFAVRAFLAGNREKLSEDAAEMLRRLCEEGGVLEDFNAPLIKREGLLDSAGVVIDALLGTGLNAPVTGKYLEAVNLISLSSAPVVSADMPSGVSSDTGEIMGAAVHADVTVSFAGFKRGQFIEPGCVCCGHTLLAGIGAEIGSEDRAKTSVHAVFESDIKLPRRAKVSHKGDYGKVLILAGSTGYTGAPVLAAKAAVRSGAGLVFLGVPESIYPIVAVKCDEAMPFPLPCDTDGRLDLTALPLILERLRECDVCLAGPGLGRSADLDALISKIVRSSEKPLILDADGINALSANIHVLDEAVCEVIITPHEGEFARLAGDLSGSRLDAALGFASEHKVITVLKGHRTITALPNGTAHINTTGNPGMAKGGSGDVLAGIISALACRMPVLAAVSAANYLHGRAGDLCAAAFGENATTPSDITDLLYAAFLEVEKQE